MQRRQDSVSCFPFPRLNLIPSHVILPAVFQTQVVDNFWVLIAVAMNSDGPRHAACCVLRASCSTIARLGCVGDRGNFAKRTSDLLGSLQSHGVSWVRFKPINSIEVAYLGHFV